MNERQFLFAVFSEVLPDGSRRLVVETRLATLQSRDISFTDLVSEDVKILNRLLKGERLEKGIHDLQMQSLQERGIITWTSLGWAMTDELRRMAAVEMLGKE